MLHTEEVIGRSEGEPREILEGLLPKLKAQANRDVAEEFQDISTATTFAADKSLFDMAREVGLEDMYHSVIIPASSALHGDWAALEDGSWTAVPTPCTTTTRSHARTTQRSRASSFHSSPRASRGGASTSIVGHGLMSRSPTNLPRSRCSTRLEKPKPDPATRLC